MIRRRLLSAAALLPLLVAVPAAGRAQSEPTIIERSVNSTQHGCNLLFCTSIFRNDYSLIEPEIDYSFYRITFEGYFTLKQAAIDTRSDYLSDAVFFWAHGDEEIDLGWYFNGFPLTGLHAGDRIRFEGEASTRYPAPRFTYERAAFYYPDEGGIEVENALVTTPEPATFALVGGGVLLIGVARRRRA